MNFQNHLFSDIGITVRLSSFEPEYHAILITEPRGELFCQQYGRMQEGIDRLQQLLTEQGPVERIFTRYFLSDNTNQEPLICKEQEGAVSLIQQPPLDGGKIAVWIYFKRPHTSPYQHFYDWNFAVPQGSSYDQTLTLLKQYEERLASRGLSLEQHCHRTWFFVRDVDTQYMGLVKARRENFEEQGLTAQTHFIASTGIGGLPAHPSAIVQMDAYAVQGLLPGQVRYLNARKQMNPTIEYGVTFERATAIEYGDRAHILVSGTASIDHKGHVIHLGDIQKQTQRMWQNVEALLLEGNASWNDVAQMIVYLRDMADYPMVQQMFADRFPDVPCLFTLAPVCRPTWLIEMECIAIPARHNSSYDNF